jgi:UDP-N-acetyl-D-mannosaminuronate dehydrogenase
LSVLITGIGTVGVACVEKFAAEGFDVVSFDIRFLKKLKGE